MTLKARKQDTRDKIQLGGLVVKAGLRNEDKAVILGMLLDAVENLDEKQRERFLDIGQKCFDA